MKLLAESDLMSPVALLLAGLASVASAVVVLFKLSRSDKDSEIKAKETALEEAREREMQHIGERAQWVEIQLRSAKAQEAIVLRLDALEHRKETSA